MKTYSQQIAANDVWDEAIGGDYLEILSSTGPVDVSFYRSGRQLPLAEALQVDSGTFFRPSGGFDRWQIRTATLQTIKIGVLFGDGGTRRLQISGSIVSEQTNASLHLQGQVAIGVAAALIFAPYTKTAVATFYAPPTNTDVVCLGGAAVVAATAGIVIAPGQSYISPFPAAGAGFYGISPSANQKVNYSVQYW